MLELKNNVESHNKSTSHHNHIYIYIMIEKDIANA